MNAKILQLSRLEPEGRTALFDSVESALSLFKEPQFGDTVFVVTDGGDNRSKISYSKLSREMITRGVRVFVFPVQNHHLQTEEEIQGLEDVEKLAESTGGELVRVPWSRDQASAHGQLDQLAVHIADAVDRLYKAQLQISRPSDRVLALKVTFADRGTKRRVALAYPRELVPCLPKQ